MSVSTLDTIHVLIEDDPDLSRAILQWCIDTETLALRGTMAGGNGMFIGTFDAVHSSAIRDFLSSYEQERYQGRDFLRKEMYGRGL